MIINDVLEDKHAKCPCSIFVVRILIQFNSTSNNNESLTRNDNLDL